MFIKNYTDTDFTIKYRGGEKTLGARDVTYVDNSWITYSMIQAMFGAYVGLVEGDTPIEDFLFDNQILAEPNKVYNVMCTNLGAPRIFIKGGKATFYFSDLMPKDLKDMYPSQAYTDVEGVIMLDSLTNYIAFKADKGTKVIFTNINVA